MASVEGKLASVGVPRLFRAVADEKRTGRLSLENNGMTASAEAEVYFREGQAYHARLIGSGVQLGTRLVSAGYLSHEDIEQALNLQRSEAGARRLGQILVDLGNISFDELEAVVRQQIEDTIFEILRWDDGTWHFETELASDEDIGLLVSVENLVMEGARRFREWHEISKTVPSLDAVPVFAPSDGEPIEVALTPDEWAFVSKVDGTETILSLAHSCGFTEMEAARTMAGMINAGLLSLRIPPDVEPAEDEELEQAFDELERALEEAASGNAGGEHSLLTLEQIVAETGGLITPDPESAVAVATTLADAIEDESFELEPEALEESEDQNTEIETVADSHAAIEQLQEFAEYETPALDLIRTEDVEEEVEAEESLDLPTFDDLPVIDESQRSPISLVTESAALPALEVTEIPEPQFDDSYSPVFDQIPKPSLNGHKVTQPESRIVAEESAEPEGLELTSIAQMFADLARPFDGPDLQTAEPKPASPPPVEVDPKIANDAATVKPKTELDPNVDVGSLIREFSALGDDADEEPADFNTILSDSPTPRVDRGRGLFGKRRK